MKCFDALNEAKLRRSEEGGENRWYARHPSQPNLYFYQGSDNSTIYAIVTKDKRLKRTITVTLGLDILTSDKWQVVRLGVSRKGYILEALVLDDNS